MTCEKKPYSKNEATRVMKSRAISRLTKKKIRVYLCPECHSHHLTTSNKHGE